jgi:hypothetical protein
MLLEILQTAEQLLTRAHELRVEAARLEELAGLVGEQVMEMEDDSVVAPEVFEPRRVA